MADWKALQSFMLNAKDKKDERRAYVAILKFLEKASLEVLEEIWCTTDNKLILHDAEVEIWWRNFDKNQENLLEFILSSKDEKKIIKAITELGNLKYSNAIDPLLGFLNSINLRDAAALALRQMPSQKSFGPLIEAIKQHPDGSECLLYALEVLDCSDAAEFLVELFISKPKALVVRDDIYVCFTKKAVRKVTRPTKVACCSKLTKAIEKSEEQNDIIELKQLYDAVLEIEEI